MDIGQPLRCKRDGIKPPGMWRTDCLTKPGKVRMESMSLCSWWFRPLEPRVLQQMHNGSSSVHSRTSAHLLEELQKI